MAQSRKYKYQSLGRHEIRLLKLYRGSGPVLRCALHHYFLEQLPPYEAVSYCWGDVNDTVDIECNDRQISITRNLYEAMLQFRYATDTDPPNRVLWADALCIDQSNFDERSQQVQLMGSIYQNARRVLIWLGSGNARTKHDLKFAASALANGYEHWAGMYMDLQGTLLGQILSLPWFSRTWVLQEVALAREATIMYEDLEVAWDKLVAMCTEVIQTTNPSTRGSTTFQRVLYVQYLRDVVQRNIRAHPHRLLLLGRDRSTTDARDKVYGMCGVFNLLSERDLCPVVDYSIGFDRVYLNFAVQTLQGLRNLDILSVPRADALDGLPSWAPRWDKSANAADIIQAAAAIAPPSAGTRQYDPVFTSDYQKLQISGILIDSIAEVSGVFEYGGNETEDFILWKNRRGNRPILDRYKEMRKIMRSRSSTPYITGESMQDVSWKTMIAGAFLPEEEADFRIDFVQLLSYTTISRRLQALGLNKISGKRGRLADGLINLFGGFWSQDSQDRSARNGRYAGKVYMDQRSRLPHRRVMRTKQGFVGLAPPLATIGDRIGVFEGGSVPLVLRSKGDNWELIGDSYVHGIMAGEVFQKEKCSTFWLV